MKNSERPLGDSAPFDQEAKVASLLNQIAELEHLYQTTPVGLCLLDSDLRYVRINERLAAMNGKPVSEHIGRTLREIIPEMAPKLEALYRRAFDTGEPVRNVEIPGPAPGWNGTALVSLYPLKLADGTVHRVSSVVQDITELKQAEEALRNSESILRSFFDSPGFMRGIVEVVEDDILHLSDNASTAAFFGQTQEAMRNKFATELGVPRDVLQMWINHYEESRQSGNAVRFEYIHHCACGKRNLAAVVSYLGITPEGHSRFAYVVQDITEYKQAEEILRESEERFRLMSDTAPVMVWMSGPDKRCTYFNMTWLEFTGRTMEQEIGNGWAENVHPDDFPHCRDTYHGAFDARRKFRMEYRLRRGDGEYRWVLDTGVPRFQPNGEFVGYIGSCIDVTEHKQAEDALRRSQEELRALTGRLISANEEESTRLARDLHDIFSQRLAILNMEIALVQQQIAPLPIPAVNNKLQLIADGIKKFAIDLHQLSRQLHPSILDYSGLAAALKAECAAFSKQHGIAAELFSEGVPEQLPGNVSLSLYRIAQEGFWNIAKHAQARRVWVTLSGIHEGIVLTIEDNGKGFDLNQIKERGGLGLVSMQERARLVHGSFSIQSQQGKGTRVEVRIPLPFKSIAEK